MCTRRGEGFGLGVCKGLAIYLDPVHVEVGGEDTLLQGEVVVKGCPLQALDPATTKIKSFLTGQFKARNTSGRK